MVSYVKLSSFTLCFVGLKEIHFSVLLPLGEPKMPARDIQLQIVPVNLYPKHLLLLCWKNCYYFGFTLKFNRMNKRRLKDGLEANTKPLVTACMRTAL